jgi:hypothetical protein
MEIMLVGSGEVWIVFHPIQPASGHSCSVGQLPPPYVLAVISIKNNALCYPSTFYVCTEEQNIQSTAVSANATKEDQWHDMPAGPALDLELHTSLLS